MSSPHNSMSPEVSPATSAALAAEVAGRMRKMKKYARQKLALDRRKHFILAIRREEGLSWRQISKALLAKTDYWKSLTVSHTTIARWYDSLLETDN